MSTTKKEDIVTVACVNFHAEWGNKAGNLARIKGYIKAAARRGADIILFPETAMTGYDVKDEQLQMQKAEAETVPGPAVGELAELSALYGVYVVVGMPERDAGDASVLYNSAVVLGPDGLIGSYRKIHPAGKESMWARKGSEPLLFDTPWGPVGVGICFDTYSFPELARYYAALGCRLYLNPTAVPEIKGWDEYYYTQLKARAIDSVMYVASANLTGKDLVTYFPGGSLIVGPSIGFGTTYYAEPVEHKEELLLATLDLSLVDNARKMMTLFTNNPITGVPDWRPGIYGNLLERLQGHEGWDTKSKNLVAANK